MNLESHYLVVNEGKIHYEIVEKINPNLPFALFLHGASPKSQHTKFWTSLIDKIIPHCNPILHDRFGHGKSEINKGLKISVNLQISSIIQIINHILDNQNMKELILIGRSQGGGYATQIARDYPEKISALGLIAPGSMKTNYMNLTNWKKPISILWDVDDPIVKFENYEFLKQCLTHQKLFTIGPTSEKTEEFLPHEGIKKSHSPELLAPTLFASFIKSLKN